MITFSFTGQNGEKALLKSADKSLLLDALFNNNDKMITAGGSFAGEPLKCLSRVPGNLHARFLWGVSYLVFAFDTYSESKQYISVKY